jgi:hypothetical protein
MNGWVLCVKCDVRMFMFVSHTNKSVGMVMI